MSVKSASTNPNTLGARASVVRNHKTLKAPEEGVTEKEYEEFLEKFQNHVTISWDFGKDIGHLFNYMEDPKIPKTTDMMVAEEGVKWKVRLWSQEVEIYGDRRIYLEGNKGALYEVFMDVV